MFSSTGRSKTSEHIPVFSYEFNLQSFPGQKEAKDVASQWTCSIWWSEDFMTISNYFIVDFIVVCGISS